jgi:hypothetical protein
MSGALISLFRYMEVLESYYDAILNDVTKNEEAVGKLVIESQ